MPRIDTHQHVVPPEYRRALIGAGSDSAGALPAWSAESAIATMDALGIETAVLSAPTPGTSFLSAADDAAALARQLNDYSAAVAHDHPGRFGFFATIPMPHVRESVQEIHRAFTKCRADGVMLLSNSSGIYLGQGGQEEIFAVLDARSAVTFIHPAQPPGPVVDGIPPFATDFLLDTARAAYLLVRNGIRRKYPRIKFILSHAGGFVPYAADRLAITIAAETGRDIPEVLADFAGFYFDTALSSSPSALPSLLAFAGSAHVVFGSDCPFAPPSTAGYFAGALDTYPGLDASGRLAIEQTNALALFPGLDSHRQDDAAGRLQPGPAAPH